MNTIKNNQAHRQTAAVSALSDCINGSGPFHKPDEGGTLRASASSLGNSLEALEERLSDVAAKLFPCDANPCEVRTNGPASSMPPLESSIERAQNTASRLHNILSSIADRL